jgi:WD40 repeat protein
MIWDLEKDKQIWSDPSAEKLEATKEYFGYPNVWEEHGEIGISAHSFVLGVTSNGKFAITGRDIWNLETLKIETISLDSDPRQITLSPDGSHYAATVYDDDLIHLFNLMDGKEILTIPNPAGREPWWQEPLFFTGDGKFLLAQANVSYQGGLSDSWTIYHVQNGTWSGELRPPLSANIQPGANYNFLKGDNPNPFWWESACDLHIYTLWPQQKINVLKIPAEPAICHTYGDGQSAYPPHQFFGNLLVTVTHNEKEYRLNAWNVETGDMFLNRAASEPAFVLGAHKDGLFFAFYKPDDGAIEIYGKDGSLVKRIEGHYQFSARKIIHSVDGKLRALLADDSVTLIDTSTQKMLRVFRPVIDSELTDTVFSTDSSTLLVVGDESQWLYSTADGSLFKSANLSFNSLNAIPGANLAVVSNGRQVCASLYDITSLEQAKSFSAPGNSIGATAISPDGSLLAISGQRNTSVFIYTAADARVAQQLPVLKFAPNWMQFSPDGKNLYVADIETDDYPDHRNMLQTWDLTTGEMTLELEVIPNWLANYISTDEFKGTDFLLKSISLSRDGSFMVMRIRALDTNKTGIWKDRHILAFWRVGEKMPFAIWKSIDFNSDQSEWLDQNGTTRFEYALPHGKPAFSPDGKYLVFDDIEWWGVYP